MEGLSTASVYISGPGGRAVAVADQGIWTMTMDAPAPQPADRRHLHLLGQADPHVEVMDDVWPFEQARRRLRRAWATDRLCRLTLVLLDPGHSLRLRRQLAPVLEDLLVEVGPAPLSELLLSAAPPPDLDLAGGSDLAGPQLSALLTELSPRLSTLREAVAAWAELVSTLPTLERAEVHHLIQTEALPRIGLGEERSVLLRWAMQQLARKPQSLSVVHTWLSRVVPQAARVQPKTEKKKASSSKRDVVQHTTHGRKTQVESQIVQITAALEAADIVAADRLLSFLREYQTDQGSRDFLAKSLCTLAQRAEALGQLAWAKNRLEEAVELAPVDPVALSQLSTWERRYGSPQRALEWMERALSNSRDVNTRTQHAETLRALGRLPEALAVYGETVRAFPGDVFARCGQAEVLRALGRLAEALTAYGETVRAFPDNVVARNGQSETLRALGRLPEALAAYGETVRAFPGDVFARCGHAEVLRALGRLPEALTAYGDAVRAFPADAVARNGRAEVLRALGRLPEALAAYGETVRAFPENAVARNGQAETLRALGRLPEALAVYGETVRAFPRDVFARCGQAEVLRALGRLPEALAAYGETVRAFPADAVARNGQASLLLRLRRAQEALPIFSEVLQHYPSDSYARAGKAMALLQLGRLAEAEALLPLPSVPATEQDYALYRFRAILECKKKNWVEAEKLLQTVTQCRFPEQKWKAAALLGGLEIRRGKTAESRKILADFPEVDALSAGVRSLMQGWTDAEARLLTEARQRLEALRSPEADVATFKSSLQRRYGLAGTKADPKVDLWEPWLDLVS